MAYIYDLADTWADGATTFTAIKMNVTDTASAAASNLMDLQVGGSSKFRVDKAGVLFGENAQLTTLNPGGSRTWAINGSGAIRAILGFSGSFCWASSYVNAGTIPDLVLTRDAANTLGQRNGVNAQTFNLYNTYTDASNYERVRMGWSGNVLQIAPQAAGTGTVRVLHISGLPTSSPGAGILWNNGGTVEVGT
jgi:hypothetical protein